MTEIKLENKPQKVAVVHDFLLTPGGAERVLVALAEMYPGAVIYTLLADKRVVEKLLPGRIVRTSFLQEWPRWLRRRHKWLLPWYGIAAETLNLRDFDLVISSSGAWSKGLVTRLHTKHIAYIHSPMRFVWDSHEEYLSVLKKKRNLLLRGLLSYLRLWDFEAGQRPEMLIANSLYTQKRIEKYYKREAKMIYPLVVVSDSPVEEKGDFFLVVSRLTPIKRIDMVVEAFDKLGLPLVVVGQGPEKERLKKKANQKIHFKGFMDDEELARLYRQARAVVFPSEEDFGLVAAEALSVGTPVIAFEYGGAREIIEPGVTGEFFVSKTREVLSEAVLRFLQNEQSYSREAMQKTSEKFSREQFEKSWRETIEHV